MPTSNLDPAEVIALFILPLFAAGACLLSAWIHYRTINREGPLTSYQRQLTKYLIWFVIGMGYAMAFTIVFHWPKPVWTLLTLGWGFMLWRGYRKRRAQQKQGQQGAPLG